MPGIFLRIRGLFTLLLSTSFLFTFQPTWAAKSQPQPDSVVERVEEISKGSRLYFKKDSDLPPHVTVPLYDVNPLGIIRADEDPKTPYLLFKASACRNCKGLDDEELVYLVSAGEEARPRPEKPMQFIHPGKILHRRHRALMMDSRAFFGKCMRGRGDVYVVFQRERLDRKRRLWKSVFIAEPKKDHVEEKLIEYHLPGIEYTLRQVKRKHCFEVDRRNRLAKRVRFPLESPKAKEKIIDDDFEEDDTPKESIAAQELAPATEETAHEKSDN